MTSSPLRKGVGGISFVLKTEKSPIPQKYRAKGLHPKKTIQPPQSVVSYRQNLAL
jgi:hypothetical protein